MKKNISLPILFCFLLFSCLVHSQKTDYPIKWSENNVNQRNGYHSRVAGFTPNAYYILEGKKQDQALLKYDYDHQLLSIKDLDIDFEGDDIIFQSIANFKYKNILLGESGNENKKEYRVHYLELDDEIRSSDNQLLLSYDFSSEMSMSIGDKFNKESSGFLMSPDSNYLALAFVDESEKQLNTYQKYYLKVFDQNMELVWEKEVEFQFKGLKARIRKVLINNSGEVQLLARTPSPNNGWPAYNYRLYHVTKDTVYNTIVGEDEFATFNANMFNLPDGSSAVVGFCKPLHDGAKRKHFDLFVSKYDPSGKERLSTRISLEDDLYLKDQGGNPMKRKRRKHLQYYFKDFLINHDDQQILLVAEKERHFTERCGAIDFPRITQTELVVFSLAFNGDYLWSTDVEKQMSFPNYSPNEMSYTLGFSNSHLHLVFADEHAARKQMGTQRKKGKKAEFAQIVKIDKFGVAERSRLYTDETTDLIFDRAQSRFLNNGKMFLFLSRFNKRNIGLLDLPLIESPPGLMEERL